MAERLRIDGPASVRETFREKIRAHKEELVAALKAEADLRDHGTRLLCTLRGYGYSLKIVERGGRYALIPCGAIEPSTDLLEQFERNHDAAVTVLMEDYRRAGIDPQKWHEVADWPVSDAFFVLLLRPDDLPPTPFQFGAGNVVIDGPKFLASLQADARRGPDAARARSGAVQADLLRLREMVTTKEQEV